MIANCAASLPCRLFYLRLLLLFLVFRPVSVEAKTPFSFYADHRAPAWTVVVCLVGLTLVIVALFRNINRRKKVERELVLARETLEVKVREQAEEINRRLDASRKEIEALLDNSPVAIIYTDTRRVIRRVNPEVARLSGYLPEEMIGRSSRNIFTCQEQFDAFGELAYPIIMEGGMYETEQLFCRKDGTKMLCRVKGRSVVKDDVTRGVIWIIEDITRSREEEREKLLLTQQLEQMQRYKSLNVMAGAVAHHFNNIMMAVQANLELTERQLPVSSKERKMVGQALKAAQRAGSISSSMLTYVGRHQPDKRMGDLSLLARETAATLDVNSGTRIAMRLQLDDDPAICAFDPGQMRQVLLNLLVNAEEAIGASPGLITIATGRSREEMVGLPTPFRERNLGRGQYVYCEISDSGCGMKQETITRIFDPFFSTKLTGRGLGLAVVVGIVKAHDGALTVKSMPGQGTTIRILLPDPEKDKEAKEDGEGIAALASAPLTRF